MMIAPLDTALMGIQRGLTGAGRAVTKIANATQLNNGNPTDLAKGLVQLQEAKQQVEASASAVHTADEVMGTLIDVRA